jgi:hypothetical protein
MYLADEIYYIKHKEHLIIYYANSNIRNKEKTPTLR